MSKRFTPPCPDRFWAKVAAPNARGCRVWTGKTDRGGYGEIRWGHQQSARAHRIAWELTHGPIPPGLCVLHTCDNPPCCEPAHLFLGTQAENLADMRQKGRGVVPSPTGPGRPPKLTADDVREIRASQETGAALGARLGVSRALVSLIRKRKLWVRVPPDFS